MIAEAEIQGEKTICACGHVMEEGDWPFCPHDKTGSFKNFRDEIPGGVVVENYGPHPIRFDSHSERRAYMQAHGLHEKEKFCPRPGTDIDPAGIPNPKGYVDPQTFENAKALILRAQRSQEFDPIASGVLQILPTEIYETDQEAINAVNRQR